eukprot:Skav218518  [mRNA]  locus=scaffold2478:158792:160202:+ [translate_table: standard]
MNSFDKQATTKSRPSGQLVASSSWSPKALKFKNKFSQLPKRDFSTAAMGSKCRHGCLRTSSPKCESKGIEFAAAAVAKAKGLTN